MRFKPFPALLALALVSGATGTAVAGIHVDYDPTYDKKITTFAWSQSGDTSLATADPMLHARIVDRVNGYLEDQGIHKVDGDPDVYVTYHTKSKEEMQLNTTTYGYGYPAVWNWDPYWPSYWGPGFSGATTTVTTYTRGTLILDVWDAASKKLIWRGSVDGVVSDNPNKRGKQVDTALLKMIKKWENIKRKAAKRRRP